MKIRIDGFRPYILDSPKISLYLFVPGSVYSCEVWKKKTAVNSLDAFYMIANAFMIYRKEIRLVC